MESGIGKVERPETTQSKSKSRPTSKSKRVFREKEDNRIIIIAPNGTVILDKNKSINLELIQGDEDRMKQIGYELRLVQPDNNNYENLISLYSDNTKACTEITVIIRNLIHDIVLGKSDTNVIYAIDIIKNYPTPESDSTAKDALELMDDIMRMNKL